jgi:cold shock CspA family protein
MKKKQTRKGVKGRVTNYVRDRGFGFVRVYELEKGDTWTDVFVHITNVDSRQEHLEEGWTLTMDVEKAKKGWRATRARVKSKQKKPQQLPKPTPKRKPMGKPVEIQSAPMPKKEATKTQNKDGYKLKGDKLVRRDE